MSNLPIRKPNRLKNYDYNRNGAYFVTICTKNREELFGKIVGAIDLDRPHIFLTELGECVDKTINIINNNTNNIEIDKYVIMPNHIHLIIVICSEADDRGRSSLQFVIRNIKSYVTKRVGFTIWQKSFYDHIIRNEKDYCQIVEYIENNPSKLSNDTF
jgi:REP element-mobilizing transposase RayT